MNIHETLFSIGLLIIGAKLLEGIFKRFGLNSIIAYAVAGVVLGPITGLIETGAETDIILGIGIFVFFFLIGLEELDVKGFLSAHPRQTVHRGDAFSHYLDVGLLAVTTDYLIDLELTSISLRRWALRACSHSQASASSPRFSSMKATQRTRWRSNLHSGHHRRTHRTLRLRIRHQRALLRQ